jgi:uncharacterized peroxidase-related enzyme
VRNGAFKANMDLRRYELAAVAAAGRRRSSYCALAHGSVLLGELLSPEGVRAVVGDHDAAELDTVAVAVIELADKVARDAASVTQADVDRLRAVGLTDTEILDVVLAAAVRCFSARPSTGSVSSPMRGTHNSIPRFETCSRSGVRSPSADHWRCYRYGLP